MANQMDIQEAIDLGAFVVAAYQGGTDANTISYRPPQGYTVVEVIYGNDLATDNLPLQAQVFVPFGFIAQSPGGNDFVVAIRGTQGILEWLQDARFDKVEFPFLTGSGDTEDGFTSVYSSLKTGTAGGSPRVVDVIRQLLAGKPNASLTITGHSLGSALVTLLAFDVVANKAFAKPSVVTFASPRTGDSLFAATYDRLVPDTWRIANAQDLVTHAPLDFFWGYEHVDQPFSISSAGKVKMDLLCWHAMNSYLYLLSLLLPGPPLALDPKCVR